MSGTPLAPKAIQDECTQARLEIAFQVIAKKKGKKKKNNENSCVEEQFMYSPARVRIGFTLRIPQMGQWVG